MNVHPPVPKRSRRLLVRLAAVATGLALVLSSSPLAASAKATSQPSQALNRAGVITLVTETSPASPDGANGWYRSDVVVSATATSSLGGDVTISSRVGQGTFEPTSTRNITVDGTTRVVFRAQDQFGTVSPDVTREIKVDKTPPGILVEAHFRTVDVSASDSASGVSTVEYRVDAGPWYPYSLNVTLPGTDPAFVETRATDRAGNVSYAHVAVPGRLGGATRYDVAVAISQQSHPTGAQTVFVASGLNFPDALAAGPAAARADAPILLVSTLVPAAVEAEIARLGPDRIVVIGGELSVSPTIYSQLAGMAGQIERIAGANRYAVSRMIAETSFGEADVHTAYVATGRQYPDALAGGGAAGSTSPMILVDGSLAKLDDSTRDLLNDLDIDRITVLGGPASVSDGILSGLSTIAPTDRLWGPDRYAAAVAINTAAFPDRADMVLLATGLNFPDALAGSAWAASADAPLFTVRQSCLPKGVADSITRLDPSRIVLLGGALSLSETVQDLQVCP